MKKLALQIFFNLLLCVCANAQLNDSLTLLLKERPSDYEYFTAPDSNNIRNELKSSVHPANNAKTESTKRKLPYPILFIHGLNSNEETWLPMTDFLTSSYDLKNGGRFDYCLNFDGNNKTSNKKFHPTKDADIAVFAGNWRAGDYYYINFDVGINGNIHPPASDDYYVLSNQSAIAKQGRALKDAIQRILLLTGHDKVVLVGHSMGGLASREYLQNPGNWQADGKHHVAKLVTTGTPHGGSNTTSFGRLSGNTEGQSEAIRDLRRNYFYTRNSGVYLFGGNEKLSSMKDQLCCSFYNADINCNGSTTENVMGLNQRTINTDLDYACIIGECSGCIGTSHPGDGIVWDVCADLNNYYPNLTKNIFYYYGSDIAEIHTDLPGLIFQNMQGMDEPDSFSLAYEISFDKKYTGFTTPPSTSTLNNFIDLDLYKFNVLVNSTIDITISGISLSNLSVKIIDTMKTAVVNTSSNGASSVNISQSLDAGEYYLSVAGKEKLTGLSSYLFELHQTVITDIDEYYKLSTTTSIYPNPANGSFVFETTSKEEITLECYDMEGIRRFSRTVKNMDNIDVSGLDEGVYILSIKSKAHFVNRKLVIIR